MPSSSDSWNESLERMEIYVLARQYHSPSSAILSPSKDRKRHLVPNAKVATPGPNSLVSSLSASTSSDLVPSKETIDDSESYDLGFAQIYEETYPTLMEVVNPLGKRAAEPEQILTTDIPTVAAQLQDMDTTSAISHSASVPLIVPLLIATGAIPTLHLSPSATPFVYTTVMPTCHFLALPSVYPTIRSKLHGSPLLRETPLFIALPASIVYHKPAMDASTLSNITSSSPPRPFDPGKACSRILHQRRSC